MSLGSLACEKVSRSCPNAFAKAARKESRHPRSLGCISESKRRTRTSRTWRATIFKDLKDSSLLSAMSLTMSLYASTAFLAPDCSKCEATSRSIHPQASSPPPQDTSRRAFRPRTFAAIASSFSHDVCGLCNAQSRNHRSANKWLPPDCLETNKHQMEP